MQSESKLDKIKRQIRALLAKAEERNAETEEAMACLQKAHALMDAYQIDSFEAGDEDPIGHTPGVVGQPGMSSYKTNVQRSLARFYGARTVRRWLDDRRYVIELFGPESARMTTELMTPFVWKQVCEQGRVWAEERKQSQQAGVRRVANALVLLIDKASVERHGNTAKSAAATQHALLIVDKTKALIAEHFPQGLKSFGKGPKGISSSAVDLAQGISFTEQLRGCNVVHKLTN
jgi:Protein of unknown function (DUF2786)